MTEGLTVHSSIEEIIQRIDASTHAVDELMVGSQVNTARHALTNPSEAENNGAWAEALAFGLSGKSFGNSPWNTHFGPKGSGTYKDGKTVYFPDIAGTPTCVIDHWTKRATTLKHPVLVARYADLAWDFAGVIGKQKRDPEMARMAIDAYLKSASGTFRSEDFYRYDALERALELAILLKDDARVDAVRAEYMLLHRATMAGDQGAWWRAFDRVLLEKNSRITKDERAEIIANAEAVVNIRSDTASNTFSPHEVESAAERLIKLYGREHRREDVKRLYLVIAKAFEHFAGMGSAMLASSLLQTSVNAYARAGQPDDAKRVRIEMQKKIGETRGEMTSIGSEVTIKLDDIEAFLKGVILEDLGQTFLRLALEFLPRRKNLEESVKKMAEEAPLMAHITQQIMADDRVVAVIGSVEDDLFGRLFQQAKFTYSFSYIWMRNAFERLAQKHNVLPEHFVGWANRLGLFADTSLLLEGVRAFFAGDYVKTAHVLIPQIEHGLRAIAGQLGRPTTKPYPAVKGASMLINMGDVLYNDEIAAELGEDLRLFFLSIYADPRGLNLRNQLSHGDLSADECTEHLGLMILHTLLVLGVWKEFSENAKKKAGGEA